jgi:hypothetical protein
LLSAHFHLKQLLSFLSYLVLQIKDQFLPLADYILLYFRCTYSDFYQRYKLLLPGNDATRDDKTKCKAIIQNLLKVSWTFYTAYTAPTTKSYSNVRTIARAFYSEFVRNAVNIGDWWVTFFRESLKFKILLFWIFDSSLTSHLLRFKVKKSYP